MSRVAGPNMKAAGPWQQMESIDPRNQIHVMFFRPLVGIHVNDMSVRVWKTVPFTVIWHWRYYVAGNILYGSFGTCDLFLDAKSYADDALEKAGFTLIDDQRLMNFL